MATENLRRIICQYYCLQKTFTEDFTKHATVRERYDPYLNHSQDQSLTLNQQH